jgi:hypothetical protein
MPVVPPSSSGDMDSRVQKRAQTNPRSSAIAISAAFAPGVINNQRRGFRIDFDTIESGDLRTVSRNSPTPSAGCSDFDSSIHLQLARWVMVNSDCPCTRFPLEDQPSDRSNVLLFS